MIKFVTTFIFLITFSLFPQTTAVEQAFPNLNFFRPTDLQNAGDGTDRLFVTEQPGAVWVFPNDPAVSSAQIFLNIQSRVLSDTRFGMLGITFHPDYENNGYFYLNYTAPNPNRTVIARFTANANDPNQADPNSELVLLEVNQPHNFHNGGQLAFGPDGYLYIGLGDGGPGNDPNNHGQNRQTLLGAYLRIDVDNPSGGLNYGIPPDNPFIGNTDGFREEIFAWGFRNPWRFSFDPKTGWLWSAGNGENRWEEINIVEKGNNYGWRIMEGNHCFNPPSGCNTTGLTPPIFEYGGNNTRRSVIGGYVYHGRNNPELTGKYIYGDFLLGEIWTLEYDGVNPPINTSIASGQQNLTTFGLDESGEIYFCNWINGRIFHFTPTTGIEDDGAIVSEFQLKQNYPNPFNPSTNIRYSIPSVSDVNLKIYNVLGQEIRTLVNSVKQAPGNYEAEWNGTNAAGIAMPSGLYIYRLTAGEFVQTRQMILLQ